MTNPPVLLDYRHHKPRWGTVGVRTMFRYAPEPLGSAVCVRCPSVDPGSRGARPAGWPYCRLDIAWPGSGAQSLAWRRTKNKTGRCRRLPRRRYRPNASPRGMSDLCIAKKTAAPPAWQESRLEPAARPAEKRLFAEYRDMTNAAIILHGWPRGHIERPKNATGRAH